MCAQMFSLQLDDPLAVFYFFFFNDTATTEIYTLSLHDALPISRRHAHRRDVCHRTAPAGGARRGRPRSEEHTSELQSQSNLVCRLLLEKKKKRIRAQPPPSRESQRYPPDLCTVWRAALNAARPT